MKYFQFPPSGVLLGVLTYLLPYLSNAAALPQSPTYVNLMTQSPLQILKLRDLTLATATSPGRPLHIAAASGLAHVGDHFYIVPDDEFHLGFFADAIASQEPGSLIRLFKGELPNDPAKRKKKKPDLEVLLSFSGRLMALPSGSKSNRVKGALISLRSPASGEIESIRDLDLAPLYQKLNTEFDGELNIEGAVKVGNALKLFQRGNGKKRINAIIDLDAGKVSEALRTQQPFTTDFILSMQHYDLGLLHGVPLSFTDATAFDESGDGQIIFSAVAEDCPGTYEDGKCAGSVIGRINALGKIVALYPLSQLIKVEGIATRKMSGNLELFMVTDGDDPLRAAELFQTTLSTD